MNQIKVSLLIRTRAFIETPQDGLLRSLFDIRVRFLIQKPTREGESEIRMQLGDNNGGLSMDFIMAIFPRESVIDSYTQTESNL
jgi:hypothetical protein